MGIILKKSVASKGLNMPQSHILFYSEQNIKLYRKANRLLSHVYMFLRYNEKKNIEKEKQKKYHPSTVAVFFTS